MTSDLIRAHFHEGAKAHLVGIGGVSMAPLAEVLHGMGMTVTGSDMQESATVSHLRSLGIQVTIGHFAETVADTEMVIRTAAVHDDNPEIAAAMAKGLPIVERAQAWGALMMDYQNAVCISGTHGKTTTTSMCTHIAMAAKLDPTIMIGGTLPLLGAGHRVGHGNTIIMESCEYCNSFLSFHPTVALILNIEADHLDFFKDLADVEHSFLEFAKLVPENGMVIANADDENTMETLRNLNRPMLTFGLSEGADVHCENLKQINGLADFDIYYRDQHFTHVELQVPGLHNVKNALAAAAAAIFMGVEPEAVSKGLGGFRGAGRRFEYKGEFNGAKIYDDYAHHPGELDALLTAAQGMDFKRIILAFQPHTYTRTKALFHDFAQQLKRADVTLLAEIFAAREKNTIGISSRDLAAEIEGAKAFSSLPELTEHLRELAQPGDLILTVGAGDIYTVGEALVG